MFRSKRMHLVLAVAVLCLLSSVAFVGGEGGAAAKRPRALAHAKPLACKSDPAAAIAALPPGGVFHGTGCYVTGGIRITRADITINGGKYVNPATKHGARNHGLGLKPLIQIANTRDTKVENVTLVGGDAKGSYTNRFYVGEAGVDIRSSADVNLLNITTIDTYGDGLTLGFEPHKPPSTVVTVNGYTINNAGRQGVTMAYATDSRLTGVTVNSAAFEGMDFESDITGAGCGDIVVNNFQGSAHNDIRLVESLSGPIIFNNADFGGHVSVINDAAASRQPVLFQDGTILLTRSDSGTPPAGIWVDGPGDLIFAEVTLGREPGSKPPTGPAWVVTGGGRLTLIKCQVTRPSGKKKDVTSRVTSSG